MPALENVAFPFASRPQRAAGAAWPVHIPERQVKDQYVASRHPGESWSSGTFSAPEMRFPRCSSGALMSISEAPASIQPMGLRWGNRLDGSWQFDPHKSGQ